jgi:hypothetical protein
MNTTRAEALPKWMTAIMQQRWSLQKEKSDTQGHEDEMGNDISDLTTQL